VYHTAYLDVISAVMATDKWPLAGVACAHAGCWILIFLLVFCRVYIVI